jgi:hypothetical protein
VYGTDAITIVRHMPKHKSVLREQAQQINFKSVLNCQNTFKSVSNLLGLFVEYTFSVFQLLQDVKIRKKLSAFFVLKTVLTR